MGTNQGWRMRSPAKGIHQFEIDQPDLKAFLTTYNDGRWVPMFTDDRERVYRSTAILGASDDLPPTLRPDQWAGQPGTRAPHVWVSRNGATVSTLDFLAAAGQQLGIGLHCIRIGVDLVAPNEQAFRTAFGLGPAGASPIRPDGYIAWRSDDGTADAVRTLTNALGTVSSAVLATSE